ncbi:MAG TPA: hypothetical protein VFG80_07175 [Myxococcota bacterium]|nr:hypothetical protein [Myxococcota bacterium]
MAICPPDGQGLEARLAEVGRRLGEREAEHSRALASARSRAEELRALVARALEAFHASAEGAGAPQLRVALGEVRLDDKHTRSLQFDLARGRCAGIVTVKSRGEVTLVGPFQRGKAEGPCLSFPFEAEAELRKALGDFLERFLEEGAHP